MRPIGLSCSFLLVHQSIRLFQQVFDGCMFEGIIFDTPVRKLHDIRKLKIGTAFGQIPLETTQQILNRIFCDISNQRHKFVAAKSGKDV